MRGSRNFCQAGAGGMVEARRPENGLDNVFLAINLFYSLQSGSNGFITEGRRRGSNFFQGVGVSKETHITCDFPGGSDPLAPSGSARGVAWRHCLLTESWSIKI